MKKVLMICYYYPPSSNVGMQRSLYFSKHLPKYGWEPIILTVKNPDKCIYTLGEPIPKTKIYKSRSLFNMGKLTNIFNYVINKIYIKNLKIYIPASTIGWAPLTIIKAIKLIKKENIDLIYASCSPFSSAISAIIIKKLTNKPLVIDFRDPWSFTPAPIPKFQRKIIYYLEKFILKKTDLFITNTYTTKTIYKNLFPQFKDKIINIYNGFPKETLPKSYIQHFKKFTIIYCGNFYSYIKKNLQILGKKTNTFFKSIVKLKEHNKIDFKNFQILFIGENSKFLKSLIKKNNLSDTIYIKKRISHKKASKFIHKSSLLYLKNIYPCIPTKLFNYIASNNLILGINLTNEAKKLIKENTKNYYFTSNILETENAILDAYKRWKNKKIKSTINKNFLKLFEKRHLTKILANNFNKICS